MKSYNRRDILQFLGRAGIVTVGLGTGASVLNSCNNKVVPRAPEVPQVPVSPKLNFSISGMAPSAEDNLLFAEGMDYHIIAKWNDDISEKDRFGFNNDYTAFVPIDPKNPDDGLLWVNHEYVSQRFVSGYNGEGEKTKEQVDEERYNVGGSIIRIKKNEKGKWELVKNDPYNRRVSGEAPIKIAWHEPIAGSQIAIGTLANCSGGITPWGSILTCEENYDGFYGETDYKNNNAHIDSGYGWEKFYPQPPEHYGWVVEVNVKTGQAKKLVSLGRCAHECATMHLSKDGRVVVYTGDDAADECLYKFISDDPFDLEKGKLYVADVENGKWISLQYDEQEILRENFKNQTEIQIRLREAAALVGGSKLDRPEDIEIDPISGHVLVSLTNNFGKGNYFGSILKIEESDEFKMGMEFESSTFLAGGPDTGFACPDNMAFDPNGNLWFTSDISGSVINKEPFEKFKNNGLYVVLAQGEKAGEVIQVASAPVEAELTGPFFTPDGKTLFLSVQHPGEKSPSLAELTSNWPEGGNSIPRPSVVAVTGPLLDAIAGKA